MKREVINGLKSVVIQRVGRKLKKAKRSRGVRNLGAVAKIRTYQPSARKGLRGEVNRIAYKSGLGKPQSEAAAAYMTAVLCPEFAEPAKIPSTFPIKSSVGKFSFDGTVPTNAVGDACITVVPWSLTNNVASFNDSTFSSFSGSQSVTNVIRANLSDQLPTNMLTKYRIVGASLRVTALAGQLTGGYFVGAWMPMPPRGNTTTFTENHMNNTGIARTYMPTEKIEILYRPLDAGETEFLDVNASRVSSSMQVLACGLTNPMQTGSVNLKWEFDVIVEYINTATNFLSSDSVGTTDTRAIEAVSILMSENPKIMVSDRDSDPSWSNYFQQGIKSIASHVSSRDVANVAKSLWNYAAPRVLGQGMGSALALPAA